MVIESKKAPDANGMEAKCQEALTQIVEREYLRGIAGFPTRLAYGVAFYQKSALVRKLGGTVP